MKLCFANNNMGSVFYLLSLIEPAPPSPLCNVTYCCEIPSLSPLAFSQLLNWECYIQTYPVLPCFIAATLLFFPSEHALPTLYITCKTVNQNLKHVLPPIVICSVLCTATVSPQKSNEPKVKEREMWLVKRTPRSSYISKCKQHCLKIGVEVGFLALFKRRMY